MRFINTLREGETIRGIYLCKTKRTAETRNGKPYDNLLLKIRQELWTEKSGIQIRGGLQIMMSGLCGSSWRGNQL